MDGSRDPCTPRITATVQKDISDHWFLSRVSILTRDIDIANLSVRPSVRLSVCLTVRYVPVSDENGLTYRHSVFTIRSPITLVLPASNTFTKFRRGHPLRGRQIQVGYKNFAILYQ